MSLQLDGALGSSCEEHVSIEQEVYNFTTLHRERSTNHEVDRGDGYRDGQSEVGAAESVEVSGFCEGRVEAEEQLLRADREVGLGSRRTVLHRLVIVRLNRKRYHI